MLRQFVAESRRVAEENYRHRYLGVLAGVHLGIAVDGAPHLGDDGAREGAVDDAVGRAASAQRDREREEDCGEAHVVSDPSM